MTVAQAIRILRKQNQESQQVFATRLGMSIASIQNYENQDRMPEPKQLLAFVQAARQVQRQDLVPVFLEAASQALGYPLS